VASLVSRLGDEFVRVRIGIGRPPAGGDAATYVLEALSGAQRVALQAVVERASDAVECIIADGTRAAMNRYNGRPAGPV
jgi:PTH1 family peptidyl-tRNA hydrolase